MNRLIKIIFLALSLSIVFLTSILFYRALVVFKPCQHEIQPLNNRTRIKVTDDMLNTISHALKFKTVSYTRENQNLDVKIEYVKFIREKFNDLEEYDFVTLHLINNSLLYEVKGKDQSLKPYMLAAHFDVVPAESEQWKYDPYSGEVKDGYINGRGTMDCKGSMLSQLEAIRLYLSHHGQPERTIYLSYGHDEEISGYDGARNIAKFLKDIELEYVLDEGSMVIEDIFPSIRPAAAVGVGEKGYVSVKFSVNVTGGHSSMPTNEQAIYILSEALVRLRKNKQPSLLRSEETTIILESLGSNLDFSSRFLLTNTWLFAPFIEMMFSKNAQMDTMQRTTTAITMFNSGIKENVLPSYAEFIINHRVHNAQSCKEVVDYDVKVVADERIKCEVLRCNEPSHISQMNSTGYQLIKHVTKQIYPESTVIPTIMPAMTDSRYYNVSTKNIYKYF